MSLAELLDALDYNQYPQYYLKTDVQQPPEIASLFRVAHEIGINGIYVFQSGLVEEKPLSIRPAVYIAEVQTIQEAKELHRRLWNIGQAPFIIIHLPDHIRVYTGFDYSKTPGEDGLEDGLIEHPIDLSQQVMRSRLADFTAESINSGLLWQKRGNDLNTNRRVDKRLLHSLSQLSKILRNQGLNPENAHALIGKYIYIRYLRDRKILSDEWLRQHNIDINRVLERYATVEDLQTLVSVLESWLNGNIFPLDFNDLTDKHVSQVAAAFKGDQLLPGDFIQQSFDFDIYDFQYIPVETLSFIYEQFLHEEGRGKKIGAFYTPEYLADYLLSEMNAISPLSRNMNILDPSCGSGIFLVLAYRRLIERELARYPSKKLPLVELLVIMRQLYGVERERDACYVTEFSILLTLLHYVDIAELHESKQFRFPSLHNRQIFHCDFFQDDSLFWKRQLRFDWIVGNPPWIEIKPDTNGEDHVRVWISSNVAEHPVGGKRVAEAFSWRITDLLSSSGTVGIILPAKSLFNHESKKYRQYFFRAYEVPRITNFSNLDTLFGNRANSPAMTIIYRKVAAEHENEKSHIVHYGPFFVNQISTIKDELWTITINESEIQPVSSAEAESGESMTWKVALWGTFRDKRALERLRKLFPTTLDDFRIGRGWDFHEGSQLRKFSNAQKGKLTHIPLLEGKKRIDMNLMNSSGRLFSMPADALKNIPDDMCYIRKRGGEAGLLVSKAPHILMPDTWNYVIYSDQYFVIPPRQIGLSAFEQDANYLQALSVFLSTSIIRYYLFFQTPAWGIERPVITLRDAKSIPIPRFTPNQVERLAQLQEELVRAEKSSLAGDLQKELDERVAEIIEIPEDISFLAKDFMQVRLTLDQGRKGQKAISPPSREDLLAYAKELVAELDAILITDNTYHHKVTITPSQDLIVCTVEFVESNHPIPVLLEERNATTSRYLTKIRDQLNHRFSQWVYIRRGLRVFEGLRVSLYKTPRLIEWTRTQALNDASDIIGEILASGIDN